MPSDLLVRRPDILQTEHALVAANAEIAAARLRIVSNRGQSLRVNVVTAAACTNSFAGTAATMLFDIDTASASLARQNPPNDGILINVVQLGLAAAGDVGFDIAGGANGLALAALCTSATGSSSLCRIDLAAGRC